MVREELMDFARRSLRRGQYVYSASFDVAGFFDGVSHRRLMGAIKRSGVEAHNKSAIYARLRGRTSQVSTRKDAGVVKTNMHPIAGELPQRSGFPPMLLLLYFNDVPAVLRAKLGDLGSDAHRNLGLAYVDDAATLIARTEREVATALACANAVHVVDVPTDKGATSGAGKEPESAELATQTTGGCLPTDTPPRVAKYQPASAKAILGRSRREYGTRGSGRDRGS